MKSRICMGELCRKINTIGLKQANKVMHLSSAAYNLKKIPKIHSKNSKK